MTIFHSPERRSRPDRLTAAIVEHGIQTALTQGRRAAAKLLERERIPFGVIVRVLAEPGRRRPAPPQR